MLTTATVPGRGTKGTQGFRWSGHGFKWQWMSGDYDHDSHDDEGDDDAVTSGENRLSPRRCDKSDGFWRHSRWPWPVGEGTKPGALGPCIYTFYICAISMGKMVNNATSRCAGCTGGRKTKERQKMYLCVCGTSRFAAKWKTCSPRPRKWKLIVL